MVLFTMHGLCTSHIIEVSLQGILTGKAAKGIYSITGLGLLIKLPAKTEFVTTTTNAL